MVGSLQQAKQVAKPSGNVVSFVFSVRLSRSFALLLEGGGTGGKNGRHVRCQIIAVPLAVRKRQCNDTFRFSHATSSSYFDGKNITIPTWLKDFAGFAKLVSEYAPEGNPLRILVESNPKP